MSPGYVLSVTIICISSFPWNCVQYKGMLHGTFCVDGAKTFKSPWRRHHVQRICFVNPPQGRTNEKGKKQGVQILPLHIVFVERLGLFCIPDHWLIFSFVLLIYLFNFFWEEDLHFLWYLWLEICPHCIILPVIITSYILSNSWLGKILIIKQNVFGIHFWRFILIPS